MAELNKDQNLLFGVVAYQLGFVSHERLMLVMEQWVHRQDTPLCRLMEAGGWISNDERELIESFVQNHISRIGSDLDESLSRFPSIDSIREDLSQISEDISDCTLTTARTNGNGSGNSRMLGLAQQRFKILRPLARGGLGQVSVAMDGELQREVALKEMQFRFADDPDNRLRFVREAEITGALEHPAIVPVYGCGRYSDGRPFFAMRLIRGNSLKEEIQNFHTSNSSDWSSSDSLLNLKKMLGRFVHVCNAVDYAHSRGVLHRDIKPSNIMLGDFGETLLVDWGLSKPLDESNDKPSVWDRLTSPGSQISQNGSTVGTPAYMSPEQANGDAEIDIRSDVFSLGATLYCMLTNRAPNSDETLEKVLNRAKQADFRRAREINHHVPRVLDAVCSKAMARDVTNRYASARTLADDVIRWIADEPTSAHKETTTERCIRWIRRHQAWAISGILGLTAITVISLAAAVIINQKNTTIRQQRHAAVELANRNLSLANRERLAKLAAITNADGAAAEFNDVMGFLVDAFRNPDRRRAGEQIRVAEMLERAVQSLDERFADNPLAKASVLNTIARTYLRLYLPREGLAAALQAYEIRKQELGQDHIKTIEANFTLGQANYENGQMDEAEKILKSTLRAAVKEVGKDSIVAINCLNDLSLIYRRQGSLEQSIEFGERAVVGAEKVFGKDHARTLRFVHNLANGYHQQGKTDKALTLAEKTKGLRKRLGDRHPSTLAAMNGLAMVYAETGRLKEATELFKHVLKEKTDLLGEDHIQSVYTLSALGNALLQSGHLQAGIEIFERIINAEEKAKNDPSLYWEQIALLGKAYSKAGRHAESVPLFEQTLELLAKSVGEDHINTIAMMNNVATAYRKMNKLDQAASVQEKAYLTLNGRIPVEHPLMLQVINNLSLIYLDLDRNAEAISLISGAIGDSGENVKRQSPIHLTLLKNLADCYLKNDETAKAIELHTAALGFKEEDLGLDHPSTIASARSMIIAYRKDKQFDAATAVIEKFQEHLPIEHPASLSFLIEAAQTMFEAERWSAAEKYCQLAHDLSLKIHGADHASTNVCTALLHKIKERLPE